MTLFLVLIGYSLTNRVRGSLASTLSKLTMWLWGMAGGTGAVSAAESICWKMALKLKALSAALGLLSASVASIDMPSEKVNGSSGVLLLLLLSLLLLVIAAAAAAAALPAAAKGVQPELLVPPAAA
jgi:hypothetical protein